MTARADINAELDAALALAQSKPPVTKAERMAQMRRWARAAHKASKED